MGKSKYYCNKCNGYHYKNRGKVYFKHLGSANKPVIIHPKEYRNPVKVNIRNRYVYHSTSNKKLKEIKKYGLIPPVYFAKDPATSSLVVDIMHPNFNANKVVMLDITNLPVYKDIYWKVMKKGSLSKLESKLKDQTKNKIFYIPVHVDKKRIIEIR